MKGVRRERLTTLAPGPLVDQGIRRLCLALIEGSVQDLELARTLDGTAWGINKPHARMELAWITSPRVRPGSFAWACAALDIDPSYLRRGLLARYASGRPASATRTYAQEDRRRLRRVRRARVR